MTLTARVGSQGITIEPGQWLTMGRSHASRTHLHTGDDKSLSRVGVTIFHVGDHWSVRGTQRDDGHKAVVRNGGEVIQLDPGIPQPFAWAAARIELPFGTASKLNHLIVLVRADLSQARWTGTFTDARGLVAGANVVTEQALRRTWTRFETAPRWAVYATACAVPIVRYETWSSTRWSATKAKEAFNSRYHGAGGGSWGRAMAEAVEALGCERSEVPDEAVRRGFVTLQDVDSLLQRYSERSHYQGPRE